MEEYERADHLLSEGRLEEAHTLYTQFIEKHKESRELASAVTDAYNSRGHIKYLWVDFEGATGDYSTAVERDPKFATAYYNRGQVKYRLGQYQEAERDLTLAVQLKPDFTDAQLNLDQVQRDIKSGRRFNTNNPSSHK